MNIVMFIRVVQKKTHKVLHMITFSQSPYNNICTKMCSTMLTNRHKILYMIIDSLLNSQEQLHIIRTAQHRTYRN